MIFFCNITSPRPIKANIGASTGFIKNTKDTVDIGKESIAEKYDAKPKPVTPKHI